MYFRRVTFTRFPTTSSATKFEEKVEVVFQQVKVASGLRFDVETKNIINTRSPVLRIEDSTFAGADDLSGGVSSNDESFRVKVS